MRFVFLTSTDVEVTEEIDVTEVTEAQSEPEVTEETSVETTSEAVAIDYTPVIYDAVSVLASVILAGALMIVGCLMAFKLWEVPYK